ncbi:hypothetical protein B1F79_03385 [Coxiella-like endosymbiont of Rhipicephalus sanguineus]|nr:hypothetical protein [Coxiella-like endosymbiont of Rhipicephalus sanguineus]
MYLKDHFRNFAFSLVIILNYRFDTNLLRKDKDILIFYLIVLFNINKKDFFVSNEKSTKFPFGKVIAFLNATAFPSIDEFFR